MSESTSTNSGENGNNNTPPRPWIDPTWFQQISTTTGAASRRLTPTAITMLNDWMRAPYNGFRPTADNSGNRLLGGHSNHTALNLGRTPSSSSSRPRSASSSRTNNNIPYHLIPGETVSHTTDGADPSIPNPNQGYHLPTSSSRSRMPYQNNNVDADNNTQTGTPQRTNSTETYVVDMESDGSTWSSSPGSNASMAVSHIHDHVSDEERGRRTPGENNRGESEPAATTPADIFRQSPEGQAIISVAERYSPFLLILLIKGLFDHGSGIVCFLALLLTFSHANSLFKKEVSKQGKRKLSYLMMITVNLLVCMGLIFYVYQDENLYLGLLYLPTRTLITSMWTMFWVTGVVDFIAKFITIILKIFVLILIPARVCPYQKRGKYYLFVERTSQLYRTSIPMYPWVIYMSGTTYEATSTVVGGILVLLYCALKLSDISKRYKAWRVACYKMMQSQHYGESPTDLELKDAGEVCPICHDTYQDPTKLTCNHIFCEECVATWFDRERTCPMCRASIGDDPSYRDGQTTHFIQIF